MTTQDDSLRWRLRGLRQDTPPHRDLWPGIAERIAVTPQLQEPSRSLHVRQLAPWAVAASVLLAVGLVWQKQALPETKESLFQREAIALTREYQGALAQFSSTEAPPEFAPALDALDRSAAQIRSAIDTDPNARFLLDQLRRTYARRLALSQRAAMT
jgi:negative regulator of sigma E activity